MRDEELHLPVDTEVIFRMQLEIVLKKKKTIVIGSLTSPGMSSWLDVHRG